MRFLIFLLGISAFSGLSRIDNVHAGISNTCVSRIDSVMTVAIADTVMPGAVIAIVRGDKLAFIKSYGLKAEYPQYEALEDSTVYDLASLSKPVSTAIAAMQLIENGSLSKSAPVSAYLPDFAPYDKVEGRGRHRHRVVKQITVRQLLLHTSGLPSYASYGKINEEFGGDMYEYLCKGAPRRNRPGSRCRYSCLNYITLQLIIEKITGERLCDYAVEHIFGPLGMNDTRYFPGGAPDSLLCRIAPTEMLPDSLAVPRGTVHDPLAREIMHGNSGNAGVFSTALDLSVLCAALLNDGRLFVQEDGHLASDSTAHCVRILEKSSVRDMFTPGRNSERTFGWDCSSTSAEFEGGFYGRDGAICHTGFTGPSIVMDKASRTAVIIMCNRVHPSNRGTLKYEHTNLKDIRTGISDAVAESVLF